MLQGILIVVAFLVVAALMMTKKIPTLLALPLMAVVICIIAGVPMFGKNADGAEIGWLTTVFEAGTVRMGSAIMATIFGAWLGQLMTKTCYDGITDAGPAVILMVGIGILFLAVTNASVKEVLNPLLLAIVPTSRVPYIIFFAILAPLALYRGPMNMFGLGSGIAALIIGLGTLNPLAVMAAFLAAERIQCGGDPTNTQNVWTANFCEVDVNTCTKKMLPYLWAVSIVGVILGAMLYF